MTIHRVLPLAAWCLVVATVSMSAQDTAYAGHSGRRIKALSAEEITSLEAGAGMGLALAAELNGYAGPRHVLELADQIELTDEQRRQTQTKFDAMQAAARRIGAEIILGEARLDSLFNGGTITEDSLDSSVTHIAESRAKLRTVHLRTHLSMRTLLSDHQAHLYAELRGYGGTTEHHRH